MEAEEVVEEAEELVEEDIVEVVVAEEMVRSGAKGKEAMEMAMQGVEMVETVKVEKMEEFDNRRQKICPNRRNKEFNRLYEMTQGQEETYSTPTGSDAQQPYCFKH